MDHVGKFAIVISACSASELVNAMCSSRVEMPASRIGLVQDIWINCGCTENA